VSAATPSRDEARRALESAGEALSIGDFELARSMARQCLGFDPTDTECNRVLVFSFTRNGEYGPELRQAIGDCLSADPIDAQCLEAKVAAEIHAGDLAAAASTLARRESLVDQPPDYLDEAELARAQRRPAEACEAYRAACRLSQEYACKMVPKVCTS
jgi:hypothetical protein